MVQFKQNKIFLDSETVAEQLRSARQDKGLKLEDIAQKLNINYKYLDALEKGCFNKLPAGAYGINFLREYAIFLGLNHKELIKIFSKELDITADLPGEKLFSRQVAKFRYFLATPKIIKNFIIAVIVVACFLYLGIALKKIISPPRLLIESPKENSIIAKKTIMAVGLTEKESQVTINGSPVLADSSGRFSKKINLKNGINIITIIAKKKYSREKVVKRQVLVKE